MNAPIEVGTAECWSYTRLVYPQYVCVQVALVRTWSATQFARLLLAITELFRNQQHAITVYMATNLSNGKGQTGVEKAGWWRLELLDLPAWHTAGMHTYSQTRFAVLQREVVKTIVRNIYGRTDQNCRSASSDFRLIGQSAILHTALASAIVYRQANASDECVKRAVYQGVGG